jgi:glycine C-acetyltransferase
MSSFLDDIKAQLVDIDNSGLWKTEETILSPQAARIRVGTAELLNLCSNNYLALADHPALIKAAKVAMDRFGYGMASVRFICGTQNIHQQSFVAGIRSRLITGGSIPFRML